MKKLTRLPKISWYIVFLVAASFTLRVWNLNYNSIFLDEAIYVSIGKRIISGNFQEAIEAFSWVGGMPFLYPVVSAFFYTIGGLNFTRFLNVTFGVVSVLLFYHFAKNLSLLKSESKNKLAAQISALIFVTTGVPMILSRIANYDIPSFSFFLVGLVLLQKAYAKNGKYGFWAAVAMLLSIFIKYITAIYVPSLLLVVVIAVIKHKSERTRIALIKEFCFPLVIGIAGYLLYTYNDVVNFLTSNAISNNSWESIIASFIKPSGIVIIFSLLGVVFIWSRKNFIKIILLLIASLLPLVFHLLGKNQDSATQHSFLSLIFLVPFIGCLFSNLIYSFKNMWKYTVIAFLVIINYLIALPVKHQQEMYWPNSNQSVELLRSKVIWQDWILAEGGDIYTLTLSDKIPSNQIIGPFVFEHNGLVGREAYLAAIDAGYFKYIQLEGTYFSEDDLSAILTRLKDRYIQILTDGPINVYELKP